MNMIKKTCANCFAVYQTNQMETGSLCLPCDIQKSSTKGDDFEDFQEDAHVARPCRGHEWVWSGVPRGSAWCKTCDETHDEKKHGAMKDLAKGR